MLPRGRMDKIHSTDGAKKINNNTMKKMTPFEETIKSHLDERASSDALFAPFYSNQSKNISDCCTYIVNTVKSSNRSGFADDEIYSMAVHYYTEDIVDVGKPISNVRIVTNQSKGDTPKPIAKVKSKSSPTKLVNTILQQSLFDDEL